MTVNHVLHVVKQNIFKCYVSSFTDGSRNKENAQVQHVFNFYFDIVMATHLILQLLWCYFFQACWHSFVLCIGRIAFHIPL